MSITPSPTLRAALSITAVVALAASLLIPGVATAQTQPVVTEPPEPTLVVASSSSLADAAVASSLVAAGIGDAVVFVESANTLSFNDAVFVRNQKPARLVLVGGTGALSAALEAELRGLVDDVGIHRLAGVDRVGTAALAAQLVLERMSERPAASESAAEPTVVLANAWSRRDVGTAAVAVITGGADVLLYAQDGHLGARTAEVLREHKPGQLVVAGTLETFGHEMVAQALLVTGAATTSIRLDGTTGARASAQAVRLAAPDDIPIAVIASGFRSQDIGVALALAAALDGSPVLLTNSSGRLGNDAKTLLLEHQPAHIVIVNTEGQYSGEFLMMSLDLFTPTATVRQLTTFADTTLLGSRGISIADRSVGRGFALVSVGNSHVCGLRQNGTIACWGTDDSSRATPPEGTFTAVAAGGDFTCALRQDGSLQCWGTTAEWRTSAPDGSFVAVAAGLGHACALAADGGVECWGDRWGAESLIPKGIPFVAISAGRHHTCGLAPSGDIECWGEARDGQLDTPNGGFAAVTAGGTHSCGLELKGGVKCWGGRTGDGSMFPGRYAAQRYISVDAGSGVTCGLRPTQLVDCWGHDEIENVPRGLYTAVSAGDTFACALRTNTSVTCWGSLPGVTWEPFGPGYSRTLSPGAVNPTGYRSVSAGHNHVCGLLASGVIRCWGSDAYGKSTPFDDKFTAVAAGGLITCGLRADGRTKCWGWDQYESQGWGSYSEITVGWSHGCGRDRDGDVRCWDTQLEVPHTQFAEISAGTHHTCGVVAESRRVECWGDPERIQLTAPNTNLRSISVGDSHACGLTDHDTIRCWGDVNAYSDVPTTVGYTSVAVGSTITCAMRPDQSVECWGSASVENEPSGEFQAVTVGGSFACALRVNNSVVCWGDQPSAVWDPFSTLGPFTSKTRWRHP